MYMHDTEVRSLGRFAEAASVLTLPPKLPSAVHEQHPSISQSHRHHHRPIDVHRYPIPRTRPRATLPSLTTDKGAGHLLADRLDG